MGGDGRRLLARSATGWQWCSPRSGERPTPARWTCAWPIGGQGCVLAGLVFVTGSAANNRKIMWADARNCANGWRSATRFQGAACRSSPMPTIITRGAGLRRCGYFSNCGGTDTGRSRGLVAAVERSPITRSAWGGRREKGLLYGLSLYRFVCLPYGYGLFRLRRAQR